jgi:hypothetical protein
MTTAMFITCPICKEQIAPVDDPTAKDQLGQHVVGRHTKRINGEMTLRVPEQPQAPKRLVGQLNRAQRRAQARARQGSSTGRPMR